MFRPRVLAAALALSTIGIQPWVASPAHADNNSFKLFAGTGDMGYGGDGGPATQALFHNPWGVAVAPNGTVYISDSSNFRVRAVTPDGIITTVAGTGKINPALKLQFHHPGKVTVPAGVKGTEFDLVSPRALAVASDGTLYISDWGLNRVLALSPDGRLSTFAGTGVVGFTGDGGPATQATMTDLGGLAVAPNGTVYIHDGNYTNLRILAVAPDGIITMLVGNNKYKNNSTPISEKDQYRDTSHQGITTITVDRKGDVYFINDSRLYRLSEGKLSRIAFSDKGTSEAWKIIDSSSSPDTGLMGIITVAACGDSIYMYDNGDDRLLRLSPQNTLETIASLKHEAGVAITGTTSGTIYLGTDYNRVHVIHPDPPHLKATGKKSSIPWWPFLTAGAVAALLGGWLIRRRRPY